MNCAVPVAVLLAVTASLVASDPLSRRHEGRFQCSGYCKGSNKFKYTPGHTYVYDYTADTSTFIRGSTKDKSHLRFSAAAHIYAISQCDLVLQLKDVHLSDADSISSLEFAVALEKHSLHFSFQDGTVDELCPGRDPVWVLNIKRGILSTFQNTMHDLHSAREKHHETDVTGTCETKYDVALKEDESNEPVLYIGKHKNLLACSKRKEHFLSLQSSPYLSSSAAQSLPLIKSQQRGIQVVKDSIIQQSSNNEIHTFRPFSKHESGAVTMVNQMLKLRISHNNGALKENTPVRRTTLLFEQDDSDDNKNQESAVELLQELIKKTQSGVESNAPSIFQRLVEVLKNMKYDDMHKLFSQVEDNPSRKFLLDAMPYVTTGDGVQVMTELFKSGAVNSEQMDSWFMSLAFQKKPTLSMMSSVSVLLDENPSAKALLGISALVHSYCQHNRTCQQEEEVLNVMRKIEGLLGPSCESIDMSSQQLIILALKAIGNAGIFTGAGNKLQKCLQPGNPVEVRLAAISAYRRLPCDQKSRLHLLDLYTNKHQDTELRIAAYLAVMQCPTSHTIHKVKDTLYSEEVNQVASFVWTHLTNLQETSSPWKQSIKVLVSSDFLRNKFKTDVRKFSRNYEGSFFSEALNAGAAAESNIIFTPQSYLPRSTSLNLTLDMFGETLNILEIGARAEGFEQIVESMFGPDGYFPDSAVDKMLKKLRDKSEVSKDSLENSINQLAEQFDAKSKLEKDPYASVYARIFGNELVYSEFNGWNDMLDIINDVSSYNIFRKITQEEDIDYTKSFVLLDGLYSIPTCIGLPLNLNLNGTAVLSFKLQGHANIKDLFTLNSIDIEGSITPSAAVEFVGTMDVDAGVIKSGIRLVNTLHTNTYVDGKIVIQGGNLVEVKLNIPREKVELLDVSSQLFVIQHNEIYETKGIEDSVENYKLCSTELVNSLTGLKSCIELSYVNSSMHPHAPYFPLTGPFRFTVGVTKVDTFNSYVLIFKQQTSETPTRSGTSLNFYFNTPGSKINRQLSAQYMIDWTNSIAKASLTSPFIKISASGKMEDSQVARSLDALLSLNDQELIAARIGMRNSQTGQTGRYEPFFALTYRKNLVADITGKVSYVEGLKCSADLVIKGLTKDPVQISGDFSVNEDKYELSANIKSKLLTSTVHGSLRFAENSLSTKATVQYRIENSKQHALDFSAKLQDNSRGSLIRDTAYVTLQMSQFPHYNIEALWDMQYSENYYESNGRLVVGEIAWQTQQLYRFYTTDSGIDLALACSLACPVLEVDYGVDILHQVTNSSVTSHFITTFTPRYKLSASLDFLHRPDQHKLDVDVNSPWYKTGIHGLLFETAPGKHEIEISSWWAEDKDLRMLNASGYYLDGSNKVRKEHKLDLSLNGALNGQLTGGITSSSSSNNQWIQLDINGETYLANATYVKDGFHFMEGTLKLADSTYGGSLVLLSTVAEKGFAVDLKLKKRLTMATKIMCDGEKHGLQFELYWDKDANPNKKISLMAQAMGNRKEVLLEIPGRYLKGEVVTIPSGVIGLLEWAEHQKISAQLEWNLEEGSAEITAKLTSPFSSLESLSLFATYTMLENEGILVVDGAWEKERLTLTTTIRKNSSIADLWGIKLITHMESTIPALEHVSFNLEHSSNRSEHLAFRTVALLKYHEEQSHFEANWRSDEENLYGDIMLSSPIQNLEYMKHILKFSNTHEETSGSLELNWAQENKMLGEFAFRKFSGTAGVVRILTPFEGYETTSAEYNFTKFQDAYGALQVRLQVDAMLKDYVAKLDFKGSKSKSTFNGNLQLKFPFTENIKLEIVHALKKGKLNEQLLFTLAEKQLLQMYLDSDIQSLSRIRLTAGAQIPNHDVKATLLHRLSSGNLQFNCEGKWNKKNLGIYSTGKCENKEGVQIIHFDATVNGTVLPQNLKISLKHTSSSGKFQTNLQLPVNILLTNVLSVHDILNWENKLNFNTSTKSGSIKNKQSFDGFLLVHEMVTELNGQQASGVISFASESQPFVIREATVVLNTPWTETVTVVYELPTDTTVLKPSLTIKFKRSKEIKIETELSYELFKSILHMKVISPFYKPLIVDASYNMGDTNLFGKILVQWEDKNFSIEGKADFDPDMMTVSSMFFIRHSDVVGDIAGGSFGYNIADSEITAHALGLYREKKTGFDLSLLLGEGIYKGSLSIQTIIKNWESLSLSGQVNLAKSTKLAVVTFSRELEDVTVTGLFGSDAHSSRFSLALGSHILGVQSFSVYGNYKILPEHESQTFDLTCEYDNKKIELSSKLFRDTESVLNSVMAEASLKTPFEGYGNLSAHGSYNMKGIEKSIEFYLIKDSWKFNVESSFSFGSEKGNGFVKVMLPFDDLQEVSSSVRYGFNPTTMERTINMKISRDTLTVDLVGAVLVTDDGAMTAGLEIKSPIVGFRKLKCSASLSASRSQQMSATVIFSKEDNDYALTGMFINNSEARLVLTTPIKEYEKIETNIGYNIDFINNKNDIKGKVFAVLEILNMKNEIIVDVDLKKDSSSVLILVHLPILQKPQFEMKGGYDLTTPISLSFLVNKDALKFVDVEIMVEKNRLVGEFVTPIHGFKSMTMSLSWDIQNENKTINLDGTIEGRSVRASSEIVFNKSTYGIQAELTSDFLGMEQIILQGQHDFEQNEKSSYLSLTLDSKSVYELFIATTVGNRIGEMKVQVYTPIKEFESLMLTGKYDFTNGYSANFAVKRNGERNYFGGHIAFSNDGTAIRIETPFNSAKDISLQGRYYTEENESSAQLTITRNGHTTILDGLFKFENNVAVIKLMTPFESMREITVTTDLEGLLESGQETKVALTVSRNSEYVFKCSSRFNFDLENSIDYTFDFYSPLTLEDYRSLSFRMSFTPEFPPHSMQMLISRNGITLLNFTSDYLIVKSFPPHKEAFQYYVQLTTFFSEYHKRHLSFSVIPWKFGVTFSAGVENSNTSQLYAGTGHFQRSGPFNELHAEFTSPIPGFEKFFLHSEYGSRSIRSELVTSIKNIGNSTFSASYELLPKKKSAGFYMSSNEYVIEFKTAFEQTKTDSKMDVKIATPFSLLKEFILKSKYAQEDNTKIIDVDIIANDQFLKTSGTLLLHRDKLETNLNISSTKIQNTTLYLFYNKEMTDAFALGGKLKTGDLSANVSATIDYDLWEGELFAALSKQTNKIERKIMWNIESDSDLMSAMFAVNLGEKINYAFDGFIRSRFSLRDVEAQAVLTRFPSNDVTSLKGKWTVTNIMVFSGDVSLMADDITIFSILGNLNLDDETDLNILHIEHLGIPFGRSKLHVEYQLLNNDTLELTSEILINGWELTSSLNFTPYKTYTTVKCSSLLGHMHFFLGYDLTTTPKSFGVKYQYRHHYYELSSNITIQKSFPLINIALKTPIKHFSTLKISNQNSEDPTKKGLKILVEREDTTGEVSLFFWKNSYNVGIEGNFSLPVEGLKSYYGTASLNTLSEKIGIVNITIDSKEFLSALIGYSYSSLEASIRIPIKGFEDLNAQYILDTKESKKAHILSISWGENKILLDSSLVFNKNKISGLSLLIVSPWTDNFAFTGEYKNEKIPVLTVVLVRGNDEVTLEGHLKYIIQDSKFDLDLEVEHNNEKIFIKGGYDFSNAIKEFHMDIQIISLSLQGTGLMSSEEISGNFIIKSPFSHFRKVSLEGDYNFDQGATIVLKWNEKLFSLHEEHGNKSLQWSHGHLSGVFNLVTPYMRLDDIKFEIVYSRAYMNVAVHNPDKSLFFTYSHQFGRKSYFVQSVLKVSSVEMLKDLSLIIEYDVEKLSSSIITKWSSDKIINISVNMMPNNPSIKVETPFRSMERILASGDFRNEETKLTFVGNFEISTEDKSEKGHVELTIGKLIYGQMEHSLSVVMPSGKNLGSTLSLNFQDSSNLNAKLIMTNRETDLVVQVMLNLRDLSTKLDVNIPGLLDLNAEGEITYKTWKDVSLRFKIKHFDIQMSIEGSYLLSDKHLDMNLKAEIPDRNIVTILGASYEGNDGMKIKMYFNNDELLISTKLTRVSFNGTMKFSSEILNVKKFSLNLEGLLSPSLHSIVSYEYNEYSGGASFHLTKSKNTSVIKGSIRFYPLFIPVNHTAQIVYNPKGPQTFVELLYEGKSTHRVKVMYENEASTFKVTADVNSSFFANQKVILLLKKDMKMIEFDIVKILTVTIRNGNYEGSFITKFYGTEYKALYQLESGSDIGGNFTLMSPNIPNGRMDVSAIVKSEYPDLSINVNCVVGSKIHAAALKVITSQERKMITMKIATTDFTVINFNGSFVSRKDIIEADISFNLIGTLSYVTLKHRKSLPLHSKFILVTPYIPKQTIKLIANTQNNALVLYGAYGEGYYSDLISIKSAVGRNEGEISLELQLPSLSSMQSTGLTGKYKLDTRGIIDVGFSAHYHSLDGIMTEFSTGLYLSKMEIAGTLHFLPFGQNNRHFGASFAVPLHFSNNMRPHVSLTFGGDKYALNATYVNLKDIQEVGLAVQYRLKRLGTNLKIENAPVRGVKIEIDLPLGDNSGHYGVDFKTKEITRIIGDETAVNHTYIGLEWDEKRIELMYSLSYAFKNIELLLDSTDLLECTLVLQLTTPFEGYENSGLKMFVDLSPSEGIILATLNYPGNSMPVALELNYELKNHNDASLIIQLQFPFVHVLKDIAIVISNKVDNGRGRFRSVVGGHWNQEKLAIHLEGNLGEEAVVKGSISCHMFGQEYSFEANFGSSKGDILGPYVVSAHVASPVAFLRTADVYIELDLMKSLQANITYNQKELFGLHIYTDEIKFLAVEVRNPWKSVYFVFGYDISKDIVFQAELSWNVQQLNKSQLGIIFSMVFGPQNREDTSVTLKLPTRILLFNFTRQQSPVNFEYAGAFSWQKDQIVGFKAMINVNATSELIALTTLGRLDLPQRSFELGSYASAQIEESNVKYADVGVEFLWDALENRNKKIGIALKRYSPVLEVVLKHVALENDLKIRLEKSGKLSYNELPFTMKIEIEYSPASKDLITFEAFARYPTKASVGLDAGFSLSHLATSVDVNVRSEIAHSSSDNKGRMLVEYLNSYTGQKHRLELMGMMSLLHPEIKFAIKTAENLLETHVLIQSDSTDHYGVLLDVLMNQKEPLSFQGTVTLQEPRLELEAKYGNSHSYNAYIGIPNSREITFGIKHLLYENEYDDLAVVLRLNTTQLLWSRVKWQPKALTDLKSTFFHEYADILHVIQSVGNGFSEVWLKDVAYKYNEIHGKLASQVDHVVSMTVTEVNEIYNDFVMMGDEMRAMYQRNDFYVQNLQPYATKVTTYIKEKATGIWQLLIDVLDNMFSAVKNFAFMVVRTLHIDLSSLVKIFNDLKVVIGRAAAYAMNFIQEVKKMHVAMKEYLRMKVEATRVQLVEAEENLKQLVSFLENYIDELLTKYVDILEPYLTYFENTMEILSRRVIDFEDNISEYVLDMVDNILGAEEVQEIINMYNTYSSWLEEIHLQEYVDKITKLIESIGRLIMSDVRRVFADYVEYVDYVTIAVNNIYKNINTMPLISYTRQAVIVFYEKVKWVWVHYELSNHLKVQIHSWIENLDKILLQLLNAIDMDASSPTKSLTPSITLRPDIGLIEYTQKLPIDWHGFNELPKFEQLQLYEQARDQANEIASLDKYRYYLMDTFHDFTNNMSLASVFPPFSANGMVIGKRHYITFDKKFYNFMGECSYLLASDFLNNRFSAFVTYKMENKKPVKKSLTVLIDNHRIEIISKKRVTVDGLKVELPTQVNGDTWVKRTGQRILVHSDLGLEVECNLHYDFCSVELSGWYFGKTGGLLGTFDYEPSNDISFPNGKAADTIEGFANSWHVGSTRCRSVNYAAPAEPQMNEIAKALSEGNECTAYFEDQLSPLRPCFSRIETQPYFQMCLAEMSSKTDGVCLAVAAYVAQCRKVGVDILVPHKCVRCSNSDGRVFNASDLVVYDGVESKMADIVFVVEQAPCIKTINLAELLLKVDVAMGNQGLDTRFSVVGFNGKEFSEPHTRTADGEIWATRKGIEKVLRSLQSTVAKKLEAGSHSAFSALWHASRLPFRATASKTILLIQCTSCRDKGDDYSDMITNLLENDITLHMLQPHALKLRSGHGKTSKVYGVDLNGAFSGRNLKSLVPSLPLLRQVALPKDLCTPLAFETNGTLFNMDRLLHSDSPASRVNMKKFLDIWARRVTLTAKPSQCQKCECVANQDGVGQIMCSKCLSPSIEQFLKEWEDLKVENQNPAKELVDYDYPL